MQPKPDFFFQSKIMSQRTVSFQPHPQYIGRDRFTVPYALPPQRPIQVYPQPGLQTAYGEKGQHIQYVWVPAGQGGVQKPVTYHPSVGYKPAAEGYAYKPYNYQPAATATAPPPFYYYPQKQEVYTAKSRAKNKERRKISLEGIDKKKVVYDSFKCNSIKETKADNLEKALKTKLRQARNFNADLKNQLDDLRKQLEDADARYNKLFSKLDITLSKVYFPDKRHL